MRSWIDLNSDMGESFGNYVLGRPDEVMKQINHANIACGFHAGDAVTMRDTVRAATLRGVTIGAHPSYPDIPGFGRRELGLSPKEISRHVAYQIRALRDVCGSEEAKLSPPSAPELLSRLKHSSTERINRMGRWFLAASQEQ